MNPTNNKPLETELVAASFNQAYKTVMALGERVESRQEGIEASLASVVSDIGDMTALTTEATDSLVAAINEVDSHADTNAQAISDEVTRATGKEDELAGDISAVETLANNNKTAIGTLSNLDTTDKSNLVEAINEVDTEVAAKADDDAVVHLTGDETVAGKKTFSTLPCLPALTTETQVSTTSLVGFDEYGNLIPALGGGGGSELPANADYVKTNAQGEAQKGTADTAVTENSTALVQSGAVFTAVKGEADRAKGVEGTLTDLTTTAKTNLVAAVNELDSDLGTLSTGKSDLTNLAPAFDDTVAYAVGDYVTYDGLLYKCISAHSAGVWVAADFTAVAVSTELISQLEQIRVLQELYDYIVYDQTTFDYLVEHQASYQNKIVAICPGSYTLSIDDTRYSDNTQGTVRTFYGLSGVTLVGHKNSIISVTNEILDIPASPFTGANVTGFNDCSLRGIVLSVVSNISGTAKKYSAVSGGSLFDCTINHSIADTSTAATAITISSVSGISVAKDTEVNFDFSTDLNMPDLGLTLRLFSLGQNSSAYRCTANLSLTGGYSGDVTSVAITLFTCSSTSFKGRVHDCSAALSGVTTTIAWLISFASGVVGFTRLLSMFGCKSAVKSGSSFDNYDTDTSGTTYCCSTSTRQAAYVVADTPEGGFNS